MRPASAAGRILFAGKRRYGIDLMNARADSLADHYAPHDLEVAVMRALVAAGKNPEQLVIEDLVAIDEFHVRGRRATLELAGRLHLDSAMHVLDAGCGIGGAARYLSSEYGCRVTGLDITAAYCRVAAMLADRLNLEAMVGYCRGDVLSMPFADASFDLVWTQHTMMNIADKESFYLEAMRVLKPGGVLACYDVLAGIGGDVYYPVPWARDARHSFLVRPEQMSDTIEEAGFEIEHWQDTTDMGRSWFKRMGEKLRNQVAPPLGIHVLLGDDFKLMSENQVRNLEENRIALIEAVARKPAGKS